MYGGKLSSSSSRPQPTSKTEGHQGLAPISRPSSRSTCLSKSVSYLPSWISRVPYLNKLTARSVTPEETRRRLLGIAILHQIGQVGVQDAEAAPYGSANIADGTHFNGETKPCQSFGDEGSVLKFVF